MISKNQIKFIKGLELKKFRKSSQSFVAEGPKLILDILPYFQCKILIAKTEWLRNHTKETSLYCKSTEIIEVNEEELLRVSFLKSPQEVLGVFTIPHHEMDLHSCARQRLCLALDDVQDPGNLGTIIRIADWFGIEDIFCSPGTADVYNPKTVQATMGAIARVRLHYLPLAETLQQTECDYPIYGTLLEGKNIYERDLKNNGLIIMGNEGKGLSPEIRRLVTDSLYIPSYPTDRPTSESLNVAIATAIVCAEFRRRG
ncbi:RNA methyltransferase [Bacteroides eggerthii]|jgi:TrmH family RNA methyltransferase|uniref:RNA methyltransferase n=1 Tax=Bacteroides eggerthii TaxID=28111 RepID=A0ABT7U8I9_9BACE|nr:RNA methyltransferase [Bacteroides eggerthii]